MVEHRLVPLRIQKTRARLQCNLLIERADFTVTTARVISNIHGDAIALRPLNSAADTAQRVEIVIDRCDAKLDGIEILISKIDVS